MSVKNLVRVREYEQNGEQRTAFDNVGVMITKTDGKVSIKLNTIPVGPWDGWLRVVDKQAKSDSGYVPDETSSIEPF
jgi:hypothetical protein